MTRLLRDRLLLAWALLVVVTLIASRIGGPHSAGWLGGAAIVTTVVLSIAIAKVAVVMFTFMEVAGAPLVLRVIAALWLVTVLGGLLSAYFGLLP